MRQLNGTREGYELYLKMTAQFMAGEGFVARFVDRLGRSVHRPAADECFVNAFWNGGLAASLLPLSRDMPGALVFQAKAKKVHLSVRREDVNWASADKVTVMFASDRSRACSNITMAVSRTALSN